MKRDWNRLDLKDAFHTMPEACSQALTEAARRVGKLSPPRRKSYRVALVAALLALGAMATAFAATQLGWTELFRNQYGLSVPHAAQEALQATQPISYQVGPMTFTYQQLRTDGHMVLSAAQVRLTDGGDALCADNIGEGENGDAVPLPVLEHYGLRQGGWLSAARSLNLPLYSVRALAELPSAYSTESMESALWQEDGSIIYFHMPLLTPDLPEEPLPVTLYMSVTQYDPDSGEVLETWQAREATTLSATPLLAEKTYFPVTETDFDGLALSEVRGELYATGAYLTASFTVPAEMTEAEALSALYEITLLDVESSGLPGGLNLSVHTGTDALPLATLEWSAALDALPDAVTVSGCGEAALAR